MTSTLLSRCLRTTVRATLRGSPCIRPIARSRLSTNAHGSAPSQARRVGLVSGAFLGSGALTLLGLSFARGPVYADAVSEEELPTQRPPVPIQELVRAYVVYSFCSIPFLVDYSPTILNTLLSIPGLSAIAEAAVRATFFGQFVGADSAEESLPLLHRLRAENKGLLFAYSVEVEEDTAAARGGPKAAVHGPAVPHKLAVEEMIRSIDIAADFEEKIAPGGRAEARKTWVAIKMTALLPEAQSLINLSSYLIPTRPALASPVPFPGAPRPTDLNALSQSTPPPESTLTKDDLVDLSELYHDLIRICERAEKRGVKIILDAEYSWYQPAIDAFALALMRRFNALPGSSSPGGPVQPLIYQTYQAYLLRTPSYIQHSLAEARAHNFALGVKLVRGAYHPHETAAHTARSSSDKPGSTQHSLSISPEAVPPVWPTKPETDACYDRCVRMLVRTVADSVEQPKRAARIGVLFGTHNRVSCELILDELVASGLAKVAPAPGGAGEIVRLGDAANERVVIGQLYGMHDALTNYLVDKTRSASPFVIKYVPYGALKEVMPYLGRRAIENKSVLFEGAAAEERRAAWSEIRKRIFG